MDIKNQVVPLELAKRLKELGITQGTAFRYIVGRTIDPDVMLAKIVPSEDAATAQEWYPAFTAEELAPMSGVKTIQESGWNGKKWAACVPSLEGHGDTLAEALANLLIRRIQEGTIDPKTL